MATKKCITEDKAQVKTVKTAKLPKIKISPKKKIVFVGSEAAPFIATGGLADVLGSLPKALAKNTQNEVSVILPLYGNIKQEFKSQFKFLLNFKFKISKLTVLYIKHIWLSIVI